MSVRPFDDEALWYSGAGLPFFFDLGGVGGESANLGRLHDVPRACWACPSQFGKQLFHG